MSDWRLLGPNEDGETSAGKAVCKNRDTFVCAILKSKSHLHCIRSSKIVKMFRYFGEKVAELGPLGEGAFLELKCLTFIVMCATIVLSSGLNKLVVGCVPFENRYCDFCPFL